MEIAIEEVQRLNERIREINRLKFDDIVWTKGGVPVEFDPKILADWKFMGFSNKDFVNYNHPIMRQSEQASK
jgi:hypothetical protein